MGWIKTRPAQKLLVRVKFTGNPYSYVRERPPLKYTQTHVCRNSYTGTRTVSDSHSCLCKRSLTLRPTCGSLSIIQASQVWPQPQNPNLMFLSPKTWVWKKSQGWNPYLIGMYTSQVQRSVMKAHQRVGCCCHNMTVSMLWWRHRTLCWRHWTILWCHWTHSRATISMLWRRNTLCWRRWTLRWRHWAHSTVADSMLWRHWILLWRHRTHRSTAVSVLWRYWTLWWRHWSWCWRHHRLCIYYHWRLLSCNFRWISSTCPAAPNESEDYYYSEYDNDY